MAWYTDLFCNITFTRETFNTIFEVEDKIDEIKSYLKTAKDRIRDLIMTTEPNKYCGEDEDPLYWLSSEYKGNMELIKEYTIELYKLNLLLKNWDACHNKEGLAIDRPDNIPYDAAYLNGDFVKTIKHPDVHE